MEEQRRTLQEDRTKGVMSPYTVACFASLHMSQDDGAPIWPAPHHWLWLALLCNQDIRRLMIIAPPESAKTTWVIAYIACSIAFFPQSPRIFGASSGSVATRRSIAVRNIVESAEYRRTFPDIQIARGMEQTVDSWSVAPNGVAHKGRVHPTIAAYGAEGKITGSRAREAIADDLHDFENSRTAHQRELIYQWLHNSFLSRLMARVGRAVMIGTMWHQDDVYARTMESSHWVVCHTPILSESAEVCATITYPADYAGKRIGEPLADVAL